MVLVSAGVLAELGGGLVQGLDVGLVVGLVQVEHDLLGGIGDRPGRVALRVERALEVLEGQRVVEDVGVGVMAGGLVGADAATGRSKMWDGEAPRLSLAVTITCWLPT